MNLAKNWIVIQAYKHNGELHRQWSHGYVVKETDEFYAVVSIRASVIESNGRKWHTKEPAIFILFKNRWYNVIAMMKEDGICYYVNLASPTLYDGKYLKYIDYDLDIKRYNDGSTKLLDVSEFKKHSEELNYGEDIKEILSSSVDMIYEAMSKNLTPFIDEEIYKLYRQFKKEVS